jgi:uncharacterized protein RhaS with RHS repeats
MRHRLVGPQPSLERRSFVNDLGEYNGNTLIQETVWLGDIPVATLRPKTGGVDLFYVHTDHLDAPRKVTRPSDNAVRWSWDRDPFGTTASSNCPESKVSHEPWSTHAGNFGHCAIFMSACSSSAC